MHFALQKAVVSAFSYSGSAKRATLPSSAICTVAAGRFVELFKPAHPSRLLGSDWPEVFEQVNRSSTSNNWTHMLLVLLNFPGIQFQLQSSRTWEPLFITTKFCNKWLRRFRFRLDACQANAFHLFTRTQKTQQRHKHSSWICLSGCWHLCLAEIGRASCRERV